MKSRLSVTLALALLTQTAAAVPALPAALPAAPSLPRKFTMTVLEWSGPARSVRPIYHTTGTGGPLGFVDASGAVTLNLEVPPREVLRPITDWNTYFGWACMPENMQELRPSDPQARFTMVYKLVSNNRRYDIYSERTSAEEINSGVVVDSPLIYVDRPVRIKVSSDCAGAMHLEADLNLPKGWTFINQIVAGNEGQELHLLRNPSSNILKW